MIEGVAVLGHLIGTLLTVVGAARALLRRQELSSLVAVGLALNTLAIGAAAYPRIRYVQVMISDLMSNFGLTFAVSELRHDVILLLAMAGLAVFFARPGVRAACRAS